MEYAGIEKYHGSHKRNTVDQTSGVVPWLRSQEGVEIEKYKRPLKEKLKPNEANDEVRSIGHYVIAGLGDVPALEIDEKIREKGSREYGLEID